MKPEARVRDSNASMQQLDAAYRATSYTARLPNGTVALRVGEHSLALDRLLEQQACSTWAFLTACNPASRPLSAAENAARLKQLVEAIQALGFPHYPGEGVPDQPNWLPEPSLLVLGIGLDTALALAGRFGQNAILFGSRGDAPQLFYL